MSKFKEYVEKTNPKAINEATTYYSDYANSQLKVEYIMINRKEGPVSGIKLSIYGGESVQLDMIDAKDLMRLLGRLTRKPY